MPADVTTTAQIKTSKSATNLEDSPFARAGSGVVFAGAFGVAAGATEPFRAAAGVEGPSAMVAGGRRGLAVGGGGVKDGEESGDGSPVEASAEFTGGSAMTEIGPV
jgi:hypothetical protein